MNCCIVARVDSDAGKSIRMQFLDTRFVIGTANYRKFDPEKQFLGNSDNYQTNPEVRTDLRNQDR